MANLTIREATMADYDILLEFEQGVIQYERPFNENLKPDKITYYDLKGLMASPDTHLVVGTMDGEIVGSGYARIENASPYFKNAQYAYLGFMYVKPSFRGQGINQKIIGALQEWARGKGVVELQLEVYAQNQNAIRAYEKFGFRESTLKMYMNI